MRPAVNDPHTRARPWHACRVAKLFRLLSSSEDGLLEEEATRRRATWGANEFSPQKSISFFERIYTQLRSPLALILLFAGVATLGLEEYVDSIVIIVALLIAVGIGVIQEGRASRAFDTLARSQVHTATVVRNGKRHHLTASELVVGDVVVLQSGAQVPADVRIIEAKRLSVNEAPLTGEWLVVEKSTAPLQADTPVVEHTNMAYMGTFVASGHGVGLVVATGDRTQMGSVAAGLGEVTKEKTPLQKDIEHISRIILFLILGIVAVIFVLGLWKEVPFQEMVLMAIAIAVASIPEGLPAAVTIVLAVGMEMLLRRGGLVRSLLAAETLGSTTYVLTDKTGTLTRARMAVTDAVFESGTSNTTAASRRHMRHDPRLPLLLHTALCASDAYLDKPHAQKEHTYTVRGEPMERAIFEAALEHGIITNDAPAPTHRTDYLSFTSEHRFAAGICRTDDAYRVCINGAPELLLDMAGYIKTEDKVVPLQRRHRAYLMREIHRHTNEGRRLLAVAYKEHHSPHLPGQVRTVPADAVFLGLLVFHDPVRRGVGEAIRGVLGAGAQVRLVTGDNAETALSVARNVGIARAYDIAVSGSDISELSDAELYRTLGTVKVFARVLPQQKLRIARVLQEHGEIVAMTGDGINDAPALQRANIGVAIGSGTEVAKEASSLVLVNDSFSTIHAAIEEGRRIVGNLRKIIGYLLATSLSEAGLIAAALISSAPVPLLPAQILWSNIIEEGFMSAAFAFEKGDRNMMKQKPRDIHSEGALSKEMFLFVVGVIIVLVALLIALYAYLRTLNLPIEQVRSIMFLAISIDSLFIAFSFRSLTTPIWQVPLRDNLFFMAAFLVNAALLVVVLTVPFMQFLLSYEPQPLLFIVLAFLYGVATMAVVEIGKWLVFKQIRPA